MSRMYKFENQNEQIAKELRGPAMVFLVIMVCELLLFMSPMLGMIFVGEEAEMNMRLPLIGFFSLVVTLAIYNILYGKKEEECKILKAGIEGEKRVQNALSRLSDEYKIICNLPLNVDGKMSEIDSLVVGPYGVWIVEVKNHNGSVVGSKDSSVWMNYKVGREGGEYSKELNNPLKQMNR